MKHTLFQKSSLSKTIHTDATVHTPFTIILFLKLVWAVKSQRHSFFSVSPHWFKFLNHLHSNLAIPMPINLELVPVPWHLVFFHSLIRIPSFLYFLIYNVFLCFFFCFLQSTQISIPWYSVSFWQALNLPPRVPFAECVAQSASLNSVIASESVALHFISNHRNTLFPCSSFWYAPFHIKSYWSFLETTEKFHADMQKDSFLRWNISRQETMNKTYCHIWDRFTTLLF